MTANTPAAHTPGPWWITDSGIRDSGGYICFTNKPTHYPGQDERYEREVAERMANARLIAAAPELLEATKAALLVLSGEHDTDSARQHAESLARSALARAQGADIPMQEGAGQPDTANADLTADCRGQAAMEDARLQQEPARALLSASNALGGDGVAPMPTTLTDQKIAELWYAGREPGHDVAPGYAVTFARAVEAHVAGVDSHGEVPRGVPAHPVPQPVGWRDVHDHATFYSQHPGDEYQVEPVYLGPVRIAGPEATLEQVMDAVADMHAAGVPVASAPRWQTHNFSGIGCDCHEPDDCKGTCPPREGERDKRTGTNGVAAHRAPRPDLSKPCPFCPAGPHYLCAHSSPGNAGVDSHGEMPRGAPAHQISSPEIPDSSVDTHGVVPSAPTEELNLLRRAIERLPKSPGKDDVLRALVELERAYASGMGVLKDKTVSPSHPEQKGQT